MKKVNRPSGRKQPGRQKRADGQAERKAVKERKLSLMSEVAGAERKTAEIEKLKGKMEIYENNTHRLEATIEKTAQEIGDIRRMILDREEGMKGMDIEFQKVKDVMGSIEPEKFAKSMEKVNSRLELGENRAERAELMLKGTEQDVKVIKDIFCKIKSTETLLDSISAIDGKLSKIKESEQFVERMAGKAENVYYQFSKDVNEMRKKVMTVERVEEMLKEMIKEVDRINIIIKSDSLPGIREKFGGLLAGKESLPMKTAYELKEQADRLENRMKDMDSFRERLESLEKAAEALAAGQKSAMESVNMLSGEYKRMLRKAQGAEGQRVDEKGGDINRLRQAVEAVAEKNRQLEKMISEIAL